MRATRGRHWVHIPLTNRVKKISFFHVGFNFDDCSQTLKGRPNLRSGNQLQQEQVRAEALVAVAQVVEQLMPC